MEGVDRIRSNIPRLMGRASCLARRFKRGTRLLLSPEHVHGHVLPLIATEVIPALVRDTGQAATQLGPIIGHSPDLTDRWRRPLASSALV
jgi:hypothetical protein